MRGLKVMVGLLLGITMGILTLIYYPQYQIHQIKKQSRHVSVNKEQHTYLETIRTQNKPVVTHVAIGDSVIRGVGSSNKNQNLISFFSAKLSEESNKQVVFENKGISGITSTQLNELVLSGAFDEVLKGADLITINIGGNDILKYNNKSDKNKRKDYYKAFQAFNELASTYKSNVTSITKRIRELNPTATLLLLELYNPLHNESEFYSLANKMLPKWNVINYEIAQKNNDMMVIETTNVINKDHSNLLAKDGIHPNTLGYQKIANQMFSQLAHQKK